LELALLAYFLMSSGKPGSSFNDDGVWEKFEMKRATRIALLRCLTALALTSLISGCGILGCGALATNGAAAGGCQAGTRF
jgi:hypothetical protein